MTGCLRRTAIFWGIVGGLLAGGVTGATVPRAGACPRCAWAPPGGREITVRTVRELEAAVANARAGQTVLLEAGEYVLSRTIELTVPGLTLRGRGGDPRQVVLRGGGMTGDAVGVALGISAPGITIADLTIREVGYHAIQVRGELSASSFTLHNARLFDTGQQLLKGSTAANGRYADDGLIACSEFGYTTHAPSSYTNAIDLLAVKGWTLRDNTIARIRGPASQGWSAGPAILVWRGSEATIVERNLVVDSFRGIALGLEAASPGFSRQPSIAYDHLGGVIRHNVVANSHLWADEGIEVNGAPGAHVDYNTVMVEGSLAWSIRVRFPGAPATVRNNLTRHRILVDSGARAQQAGNVSGAVPAWFVNPAGLDFRLTDAAQPAIDAGVPIDGITLDFDRRDRLSGRAPDAGAFERRNR